MLVRAQRWAAVRPDVAALALVGSWARGTQGPRSDVDLVLLTDDPSFYVDSDSWISELGAHAVARTTRWGAIIERRLRLSDGLELEFGIGRPDWAQVAPLDPGTARVAQGMRVLHDPRGVLARLHTVLGS